MKLDKNEEQRRNNQIYLEEQGILIILDSFLMTEVMETRLLIKKKDMASLFSCQEAATVIHHGEQDFLIFTDDRGHKNVLWLQNALSYYIRSKRAEKNYE